MASQSPNHGAPGPRANSMTTMLASCWGLVSAYVLCAAIMAGIAPKAMAFTIFATLVPLVAVWATIERKRWGRLALFGLSATAIGLFIAAFGLVAAFQANGRSAEDLEVYLPHFVDRSVFGALVLVAVINAYWLRRPAVIAEFEFQKRSGLAIAQRVIATSLVGCWGMTMILTPYISNPQLLYKPTQTEKRNDHKRNRAHERQKHK